MFREGAGRITMLHCERPPSSGLERPQWDVTLQEVPEGWPGVLLVSDDYRVPNKLWELPGCSAPLKQMQRLWRSARVQLAHPTQPHRRRDLLQWSARAVQSCQAHGAEGGGEGVCSANSTPPLRGIMMFLHNQRLFGLFSN